VRCEPRLYYPGNKQRREADGEQHSAVRLVETTLTRGTRQQEGPPGSDGTQRRRTPTLPMGRPAETGEKQPSETRLALGPPSPPNRRSTAAQSSQCADDNGS
jgi:hypothetical protein